MAVAYVLHMPFRSTTVPLVAVLLLVGLGCGSTSAPPAAKKTYEQKMQAVSRLFQRERKATIQSASISNLPRWAEAMRQTAAIYSHVIARLEAIAPPKEVASDHSRLLAGFRAIRAAALASAKAAARGDGKAAFRLTTAMDTDPAVGEAGIARADFRKRGYALGVFTQG